MRDDELREVIRAIVREELDIRSMAFFEGLTGKSLGLTVACRCDVLGADGRWHVNRDCTHCGGTGRVAIAARTREVDADE